MFFRTMKINFLWVLGVILFTSCSEYQKVLQTDDVKRKYVVADSLYKQKKYKKALRLMEQIVPAYRGKPQAQPLMYRYANTFYNLEDYLASGYQFERFETSFPKSDSVQIAAFLSAKSYYNLSPRFSLDQKDTYLALEKLQDFLNKYPNSEHRQEANTLVKQLKGKVEEKDYKVANQFLKLSDFKSAISAYDNFISDHPGSSYRKNAFYERAEAAYLLATKSRPSLVKERLTAAKKYYDNYLRYYKDDADLKEKADELIKNIEERIAEEETELNQ